MVEFVVTVVVGFVKSSTQLQPDEVLAELKLVILVPGQVIWMDDDDDGVDVTCRLRLVGAFVASHVYTVETLYLVSKAHSSNERHLHTLSQLW